MHIYFLTRGNRRFTREFIDRLEDLYFKFLYEGKTTAVQFSPKEVRLWEGSIPEDKLQDVVGLLGQDYKGNKFLEKLRKYAAKLLKLDPIPKDIKTNKKPVERIGVGIHLVGVKKDEQVSFGEAL